MHIRTFHTSIKRIEYTFAASDIRMLALAKARTHMWAPIPLGMRETIDVDIEHDEDTYGTRVLVRRMFEPADETPVLSVDAVDPSVPDPGTPTPRVK